MSARPPVPIRIRGAIYPSIAAAARAHRVTRDVVVTALDRGTLDDVGLAPVRGPNVLRTVVNGVTYPSFAAAAAALGMGRMQLTRAARRGEFDLLVGSE